MFINYQSLQVDLSFVFKLYISTITCAISYRNFSLSYMVLYSLYILYTNGNIGILTVTLHLPINIWSVASIVYLSVHFIV